jgi:geranylgeranyl diphosphate synthase, type II
MSLVLGPLWLKEYADCIDTQLSELHLGQPPRTTALQRAANEALSAGGKRVRAVLALLWCEVFSGDYKHAIPVAVAYELAHATALIQDDIIDNSDLRRGKRSVVAKYGLSNAILTSDLLLFHVPKMVSKYRDLSSERLCALFDLLGDSCRASIWGEFLDLEMAAVPNESGPEEQDYEEMIRLKTASLLGAPAASGAIVGGASDEEVKTAYKFGECLGMAYQIQDDLLDLMGDEGVLGKQGFTDVKGGKRNVVLIHSLDHCSEEDRSFIVGLLGRREPYSESELQRARQIFTENGSVEYARTKVGRYVEQARGILSVVAQAKRQESMALQHLNELTDYLSKRYY